MSDPAGGTQARGQETQPPEAGAPEEPATALSPLADQIAGNVRLFLDGVRTAGRRGRRR